ncbi:unnamed protein product [Pneumocystis jirovecii]|uniref:Uncharacterized protein n=2 Tax=Pneumocystis jirovecii TaxID=42068 RepID=L0PCV4_PNEJI|nr:unnamed protein product [Pneumocystis jirovecii]
MTQFSDNVDIYNDENILSTEETSLLGHKKSLICLNSFSKKSRFQKIVFLFLKNTAILCVVVILFVFGLVLINGYVQKKSILDVFYVTFNRVDIKNITENGLEVQVIGSIVVDLSKISSTTIRGLWRFSSGMIKRVTLYPSNISFSFPDYMRKSIAVVTLPKFEIDIRDWYRTSFNELVFINFRNATPFVPIFRTYFRRGLHNINVSGKGFFYLRLFRLPKFRVFIHKSLTIYEDLPQVDPYKLFDVDSVRVKDYSTAGGLEAKVQLSSRTIFSVSAPLSHLTWYALIPSCDQIKYIKIAEIVNYLYYVESTNRLNITLVSYILPFNNELLEACHGSGISPLNKLVSGYLSGQHSDIYIEGHVSKSSTEASIPLWLSHILTHMKILVPFPEFFKINLLRSIKINKLFLGYYQKDFVSRTFFHFPDFVCDITVKIELPNAFDFYINITHIRSNIDCLDNGTAFVGLIQNDWVPSTSIRSSSVILNMTKFNGYLKQRNVSLKMDSHLGFVDTNCYAMYVIKILLST